MIVHSHESSSSSQRSGYSRSGGDYSAYLNAAGLPTPPLSSSHTQPSISEALSLDTGSERAPSVSPSAFEMNETDDPAVRMSLFPHPPRQLSLNSGHSSHSGNSGGSVASPRSGYIPRDEQRLPYPAALDPRTQYADRERTVPRPHYIDRAEPRPQYVDRADSRPQYIDRADARPQYIDRADARAQYIDRAEPQPQYVDRADPRPQYVDRAEPRAQYATQVDSRVPYSSQNDLRYYQGPPSPAPAPRRNGTLPNLPIASNGSPHLQPLPLRTAARPPPRQQSLSPLSPTFHIPYTCAFSHRPNGDLVLEPPEGATDITPLYVINVHPNVFVPTSYITTIRRGRAPQDIVGRFECVNFLSLTKFSWS